MAGNADMELASIEAGKELAKAYDDMTELEKAGVRAVALWWKQNYLKTGHKNLAWQLMEIFGK